MELWRLPAVALSALIERKEASPVEVLEVFLERCARLNPMLNAIVAFDHEAARHAAAAAERRMQQGSRLGALDGLPVTLTPVSAALPWPVGQPYPTEIDGRDAGPRAAGVFATFVNAAGLPAISMPVTPAASGLPIGMQLVGAFGNDSGLLALASEFERSQPWAARWPAIAGGVEPIPTLALPLKGREGILR